MANQSKLVYTIDLDSDTELEDSDKENQVMRSNQIQVEDHGTVEEVVRAERYPNRKQYSYKQRIKVHILRDLGWTMRQISDYTQISLGCVYSICNTPTRPTK